jgi:RHS repeat-associated protein
VTPRPTYETAPVEAPPGLLATFLLEDGTYDAAHDGTLDAAYEGAAILADEPCMAAGGGAADPTGAHQYYRARYYDPKIGRFISEDPAGMVDGPNLYSYVNNNPVRYIDPSGLASCECPTKPKNCLELLFKKPVGGVKIVTKPPSKKWDATTRKNKIIVYGSCEGFFGKGSEPTVLEEYYHVLEQWNTGRLSKLKYIAAWAKDGYDNKWEREAKAWTSANLRAYLDCLEAPESK